MSTQKNMKTRRAIDFFGDGWKEIRTQIENEIFIFVKKIYWLKIGLLLVFSINFLSIIWKNNVLAICISY